MSLAETYSYSEHFSEYRKIDIYRPLQSQKTNSAILIIPSTNWRNGSRAGCKEIAANLCSRGSYVAVLDYRLPPSWNMPAPIEDVRLAIQFLKRYLVKVETRPIQILLMGFYAGAYLALLASTIKWGDYLGITNELKDENTQVKGLILFSPIVSLEKGFHSKKVDGYVEALLGFDSSREVDFFIKDISPLHQSKACNTSILLFVAAEDSIDFPKIPLQQFFEEYQSCKVPIKRVEFNMPSHNLESNTPIELNEESIKQIFSFVQEYIL